MDLNKKETKLLHKVDAGWTSLEMDKEGKTLFILNGKNMQKMNLASDDLKPIKYLAQVKLDLSAEREYMYTNNNRSVSITPTCMGSTGTP